MSLTNIEPTNDAQPYAAKSGLALIAINARTPREAAKKALAQLMTAHGDMPEGSVAPYIAIADEQGSEWYYHVGTLVVESLLGSACE